VQQNFHTHCFSELVNKKITQEIICDINNFNRLDLFVATYQRKNVGDLTISISDGGVDPIRSSSKPCKDLTDNEWNSFSFHEIKDSRNKKFTVTIETIGSKKNLCPTIYYIQNTFPFGNLFHNNMKINGCLTFRVFGKKT
jgi:hypothetical protein